jgi:tRNA modification GTPase
VTPTPGTTRDLVTERVSIDGIPVELVDTAGLREAADEAERIGIAKSHEAMAESDVVLLVVDSTAGITAEDRAVIGNGDGRDVIVAMNKSDLVRAVGSADTHHYSSISTSALTGEGIAEVRAAIVMAVAGERGGLRESGMLTNVRQHQAVERAVAGLDAARAAIDANIPHEMVLLDLYEALRGLDALTGATTTEDVLRLIFSTFCIGK